MNGLVVPKCYDQKRTRELLKALRITSEPDRTRDVETLKSKDTWDKTLKLNRKQQNNLNKLKMDHIPAINSSLETKENPNNTSQNKPRVRHTQASNRQNGGNAWKGLRIEDDRLSNCKLRKRCQAAKSCSSTQVDYNITELHLNLEVDEDDMFSDIDLNSYRDKKEEKSARQKTQNKRPSLGTRLKKFIAKFICPFYDYTL